MGQLYRLNKVYKYEGEANEKEVYLRDVTPGGDGKLYAVYKSVFKRDYEPVDEKDKGKE